MTRPNTTSSPGKRARVRAPLARVAVGVAGLLGAGVVGVGMGGAGILPARAAAAAGTTSTTEAGVELPGGGLSFRGAVITAPGKPTRRLTAYQSAVFVQKWIVDALYGKPKHEAIPPGVTAYRVDVTGTWGGGAEYETRPVFYASDGTQAWIVFPDPSKVPSTGIPGQLDWFVAPPQVIAAFGGTGKLVPTATQTPTTTGNAAVPAGRHSSGDDGGSAWVWIVGVVAVVALGGAVLGWRRSRTRAG